MCAPRFVELFRGGKNLEAISIWRQSALKTALPAMGTALAFIPSVAYYCFCIVQATKLEFGQIFPLFGFLRVLASTCVASLPAWWFKSAVAWPAAARLPVRALLVLGTFALLGTMGEIRRHDWAFLANWLRLRMLRTN